jgi:hypothetical protein
MLFITPRAPPVPLARMPCDMRGTRYKLLESYYKAVRVGGPTAQAKNKRQQIPGGQNAVGARGSRHGSGFPSGRLCERRRGRRGVSARGSVHWSGYDPWMCVVCVFITAGPSTKLFAWGGVGILGDMCYERRRAEACVD